MIRKTFSAPFYSLPLTSVTHRLEPFTGTYCRWHKSGNLWLIEAFDGVNNDTGEETL